MRRFLQAWFTGFYNPVRAVEIISELPAPFAGLLAVAIRATGNSLLWYLPQYLAGRLPVPEPYITIVPANRYYLFLVWFTPINHVLDWLLVGALFYFVFRLGRRNVDLGAILNISGVASLVSGTAVLAFDLIIRSAGLDISRELWGGLHLVLDGWYCAITIVGFQRKLKVQTWLGVAGIIVVFAINVPIAMLFMRA